jgi:hypothetical protein
LTGHQELNLLEGSNVRKTQTEEAAMKPSIPKTELPPSTQLRKVIFGGSHVSFSRTDLFTARSRAEVHALRWWKKERKAMSRELVCRAAMFLCLLVTAGTTFGQMNLQFKEGTLESPEPGGGSNKFNYRKGAFYGRLNSEQATPSWYNMSWEMNRPVISSGVRYTDENLIQGYVIYDVRAHCDFDGKGVGTWRNLNPATTGVCYTGSIATPSTNRVDRVDVSTAGSMLLHLVGGSQYFARDSEVTAITNAFPVTQLTKDRIGCVVKKSAGKESARLFLDRKVIVAGPAGMNVRVNLLNGELDIGEMLRDGINTTKKK